MEQDTLTLEEQQAVDNILAGANKARIVRDLSDEERSAVANIVDGANRKREGIK